MSDNRGPLIVGIWRSANRTVDPSTCTINVLNCRATTLNADIYFLGLALLCGNKLTTKLTIFTLIQHHAHCLTVEQSKARDACYSCYDKSVQSLLRGGGPENAPLDEKAIFNVFIILISFYFWHAIINNCDKSAIQMKWLMAIKIFSEDVHHAERSGDISQKPPDSKGLLAWATGKYYPPSAF